MPDTIRFSVVIPTRDRASALRRCVESVASQTIDPSRYEILIVNDGSTDETPQVIEKLKAEFPAHRILSFNQKHAGCAKARNAGIRYSQGSIVFFTDDDCVVPSDWIERHADAHARYPDAAGVGGWYFATDEARRKNRFLRFFDLQFEYDYPGMKCLEVHSNSVLSPAGNTANVSYKRASLSEAVGFDEGIPFTGGVDWELKTRMAAWHRQSFAYVPLHVEHEKQMDFIGFLRTCFRRGRGADYRSQKFGFSDSLRMHPPFTPTWLAREWGRWKASPVTRGSQSGLQALNLACFLAGKYANRVLSFKPIGPVSPAFWEPSWEVFTRACRSDGAPVYKNESKPFTFLSRFLNLEAMRAQYGGASLQDFFSSVVVPVYNREALIAECLLAILRQDTPPERYEIVVVDDGSTDRTASRVRELQEQFPGRVRYVFQENVGSSGARNRGAAEARGDIILFTDSDCVVPGSWINMHLEAYLAHPELAGVGGAQLNDEKLGIWTSYKNGFYHNLFAIQNPNRLVVTNDVSQRIAPVDTANLSVRANVFRSSGGFLQPQRGKLFHEDAEFCYRLQREGHLMAHASVRVMNVRRASFRSFAEENRLRGWLLPFFHAQLDPLPCDSGSRPTFALCVSAFGLWMLRPARKIRFAFFLAVVYQRQGYRAKLRALAREKR